MQVTKFSLKNPKHKIALVALLVISIWVIGYATGLSEKVTPKAVRGLIEDAGPFGYAAFIAAFMVGQLVHLPGMLFLAASVYAWGPIVGGLLASIGSVAAVSLNFFVIRQMAGTPIAELKYNWMKKVIKHLDTHPILTIAILRIPFLSSPQLSVVMAMSNVRARDHMLGSALGMMPMMFLWAQFFPYVFKKFAE